MSDNIIILSDATTRSFIIPDIEIETVVLHEAGPAGPPGAGATPASFDQLMTGTSTTTVVNPARYKEARVERDFREFGARESSTNAVIRQAFYDAGAELVGGQVLRVGSGVWDIDMPILVPSGMVIRGNGRSTVISNTDSGLEGACFMFGVYHPSFSDDVDVDTITVPTPGERTITRTSSTLSLAVGDEIIVFDSTDGTPDAGAQFIRQIVAISGSDITLDKPLDRWWSSTTDAHITKGDGYTVTYAPLTGPTVPVDLAPCHGAGIENLAVESSGFYWLTRGFARNCWAEDIYVIDSGALVFGSGLENCRFERISGYFRDRAIEMTDGARDNTCRAITGTCTAGTGWEATDPLIWGGVGFTLDGFDITDDTPRNVAISMVRDHTKIRNGHLRLKHYEQNIIQYGDSGGGIAVYNADVDNVTLHLRDQITADVIRLFHADTCTLRKVIVESPNGYDTGDSTLSINIGNTNCLVDGLYDAHGVIEYSGGAIADPLKVELRSIGWIGPTYEPVNVSANQCVAAFNTPDNTPITRWPAWNFDASTAEAVSTLVRLPSTWATFQVKAKWVNAGAGSGNVRWRLDRGTGNAGSTIAQPGSGTVVTATAGAQNVIVETLVLTTGTKPTDGLVNVVLLRFATDVLDTLPNDAALLSLSFERLT